MFDAAMQALRALTRSARPPDDTSAPSDPQVFACPVCDGAMACHAVEHVAGDSPPAIIVHNLVCEACGMLADRIHDPVRGYDRRVVI